MQYIQIELWPAAVALGIGASLTLLLHAAAHLLEHAVRERTRRALQRAIDEN
jgi:hypothetical protein